MESRQYSKQEVYKHSDLVLISITFVAVKIITAVDLNQSFRNYDQRQYYLSILYLVIILSSLALDNICCCCVLQNFIVHIYVLIGETIICLF